MYLSLLKLNPRSRRAMTEATRPYELHRSLMRAFPDKENGGPGGVLFRLDTDRESGSMCVLVQSDKEPQWSVLDSAGGFLLEPVKYKTFDPRIAAGQMLYFRLRANPTRRDREKEKRIGIPREEDQIAWLRRKAKEGRFEVVSVTVIPEGMAHDNMTDGAGSQHDLSLLSVRFEGVLRVADPDTFLKTLEGGIGSGKGLGFGLLSVAPLREVQHANAL